MTKRTKIILAAVFSLLAAGAVGVELAKVQAEGVAPARYTANAGELTGNSLVGQTFVAPKGNLSGIGVMMATYSGRTQTQPVYLHLKSSISAPQDLRTVRAAPDSFGDNQLYRFSFAPLPDSERQTYFFFVSSPLSRMGDAITVDLNTNDPYHEGSAFIVREASGPASNPDLLARSGKPAADVVFATYHEVPLRQAAVDKVRQAATTLITTWPERRGDYFSLAGLMLPAAGFVALLLLLARWQNVFKTRRGAYAAAGIMMVMMLAGFWWRWQYAARQPLTSDEGNYLYDAWTLLQGRLAGGDGYVKSPLVIIWLAFWQIIIGHTFMAGRAASMIIGILTAWPLYQLGREMYGRAAGLAAAGAWLFFGAPAVFNIYAHTQALAIFFGVLGAACVWLAVRGRAGRLAAHIEGQPSSWRWFAAGGIILGLGVISRKSILALGLLPLLMILLETRTWRLKMRQLLAVGFGFLLVLSLAAGWANYQYGREGVVELIGLNSAEDGLRAADPLEKEKEREYSLRGMTPFFREAMPLIILSLVGWGLLVEGGIREVIARLRHRESQRLAQAIYIWIIPKLGWLLPLHVYYWAWGFFRNYEGGDFISMGGMRWLWFAGWIVVGAAALLPPLNAGLQAGGKPMSGTLALAAAELNTLPFRGGQAAGGWRESMMCALLLPLWAGGLVLFYMNWIKFHANYIAEFLPPLAVTAGLGAWLLWQRLHLGPVWLKEIRWRRAARAIIGLALAVVILWSATLSNYITFHYPHTGTLDLGAIKQAALWAKANIPIDQPIFTGAAAVPYESGHRVALDIAHPRWYAYEFTRTDTERLNTFLPPAEAMVQAFRDAQWVLMDSQTGFSFIQEYSMIEKSVNDDFVPVKVIENGSNPLTFYRRVR